MTPDEAPVLAAVLLDVNGTLTDPAAIGAVWDRPELGDRVLAHAIHTATVQAVLGEVGSGRFADHLRAAIEVVVADEQLDRTRVDEGLAAAAGLPARPGAQEALASLRDAGLAVVGLTNSGAQAGARTIAGCGLDRVVDRVLGVDAVATFKPDPAVYGYALSELGEPGGRVALLATHPWDLAGAAHSGMRTAWVRHGERAWPSVFAEPTVWGETLPDVAHRLIALARAPS